jgi:hypothetical protein
LTRALGIICPSAFLCIGLTSVQELTNFHWWLTWTNKAPLSTPAPPDISASSVGSAEIQSACSWYEWTVGEREREPTQLWCGWSAQVPSVVSSRGCLLAFGSGYNRVKIEHDPNLLKIEFSDTLTIEELRTHVLRSLAQKTAHSCHK